MLSIANVIIQKSYCDDENKYLIKLINSLDQLLLDHQCQLVILKRGAIFYVKNELLKTLPNPHSHLVKYEIAIPTVFQPLKA